MRRKITGPAEIEAVDLVDTWQCRYGLPGFQLLDSLAADAELVDFVPADDILTTNICFGVEDLTTAHITLSGTGRLPKAQWSRSSAKLNHLST